LAHAAFPLGNLFKQAVREMARRARLPVAEKPESQESCFVLSGNYTNFIDAYRRETSERGRADKEDSERRRAGKEDSERSRADKDDSEGKRAEEEDCDESGELVSTSGQVFGRHSGIQNFTVGQRRGLRIAAPRPLYVLQIDADARRVTVGEEKELWRDSLEARDVNWIAWPGLDEPLEATVKIRYRHEPAPARIEPADLATVRVHFHTPQRAITPGQAAVFYRGDEVLGGGWIR